MNEPRSRRRLRLQLEGSGRQSRQDRVKFSCGQAGLAGEVVDGFFVGAVRGAEPGVCGEVGETGAQEPVVGSREEQGVVEPGVGDAVPVAAG